MKCLRCFREIYSKKKSKINKDILVIKHCFVLLSKRELRQLGIVSLAQFALSIIDFIGVFAIGLVGMLSVYGIQSRMPSEELKTILEFLGINHLTLQYQTAIIGGFAGLILIIKSIISALINRKTLGFLANRSADISARLIAKLAFSNFEQIKRRSRFENIFALTNGVQSISVGVIGTVVNLLADLVLIATMFLGLVVVDASIAFFTVFFFGIIAIVLYRLVNKKVAKFALESATIEIENNRVLYELLGTYREIFAGGIRQRYVDKIAQLRRRTARNAVNATFVRDISKYVLEVAFVIGAISFIGVQFLIKDAVGAISSISLFVASAGRIIPAVLRLQSAALTFRGSLSGASMTLDLIEELDEFKYQNQSSSLQHSERESFSPEVSLIDVDFKYAGQHTYALSGVNLGISKGEWIAIVGPSGAGKTTLVDLLLGLLKPSRGQVEISGVEAEIAVTKWPGAISYVPQDSFLLEATLEENVALGLYEVEIDSEKVRMNLRRVGLSDLAQSHPLGLKFEVGELGTKLSGGQRQRVGIARALYSNPRLLILDEATSALDAISESHIVECLNSLKGETTIVSIAHRLSTVMNADRLIYMENGRIVAEGSFAEIRSKVPNFDLQANLSNIGWVE